MKKKIRSNALSQGLGDKINSGLTPENVSVIKENGNYKLIFMIFSICNQVFPLRR